MTKKLTKSTAKITPNKVPAKKAKRPGTLTSSLNRMTKEFYAVAKSKGFHDKPVPLSEMTSNLHGEVSELWEAYRKGLMNQPCDKAEEMEAAGIPALTCAEEELADILIRVLDTAGEFKVDMARAVHYKNEFNKTRKHRNGGKIC